MAPHPHHTVKANNALTVPPKYIGDDLKDRK